MTRSKEKCKCGKKADVYVYFYNKIDGKAFHLHTCVNHYKEDLKMTIDMAFPYNLGKIDSK